MESRKILDVQFHELRLRSSNAVSFVWWTVDYHRPLS